MKFHKIIPYKIKRLIPMAMIAGMPLIPTSCIKNNPDDIPNPNAPHHNTTYVWGEGNWGQIWPADKVAASADSILVDYVILQNDGNSFKGKSTNLLLSQLNIIINEVKPENRHKIRGAGTLNDLGMSERNEETYRDSIALAQMGFKFGNVWHIK